MTTLLFLLACATEGEETAGEAVTLSFLAPTDGEAVVAGDVAVSVVVDGFTLQDPAKHNEGAPEGYLSVTVDGAEVLTTGETQFSVNLSVGEHVLGGELFYADGDALEPPVSAEITVTAE
jgi:hypothetical protein